MGKKHALLVFVVFAVLVVRLPAQTASVSTFGNSCCKSALTVTGLPALGKTFVVKYAGPNFYTSIHLTYYLAQPWLILGVSDKTWSGVALPWKLPPGLARPGTTLPCKLLVSFDAYYAMPLAGLWSYKDALPLTVPKDSNLLGVEVFAQWGTLYYQRAMPSPPTVSWCTSNAVKLTIGN